MPISLTARRALAIAISIVTALVAAAWTVYGGDLLYRFAWTNLSQNIPLSKAGGPRPDTWDQSAHIYYWVSAGSLALATGSSAALLVLIPRPTFRNRAWIYLMFLAVLLPASWYNYGQKDIVLSTQLQVLLNCAVIILSATVSNWLSDAPTTAPDIKVLKYFALSLLLLAGVLVPGIFTVVWLLVAGGLLTVEQSQEISFANIAALSSVVSAFLSWLVFARDRRKAEAVEPPIKIYR